MYMYISKCAVRRSANALSSRRSWGGPWDSTFEVQELSGNPSGAWGASKQVPGDPREVLGACVRIPGAFIFHTFAA